MRLRGVLVGSQLLDDSIYVPYDSIHLAIKQLRSLLVPGTKITDAGMRHLTTLAQLESLNLSRTQISNAASPDPILPRRAMSADHRARLMDGCGRLPYNARRGEWSI